MEIRFDNYFPAIVRLWPSDRAFPLPSPAISSIDCSLDTVN